MKCFVKFDFLSENGSHSKMEMTDDASTLPAENVLSLGKRPTGRTHGLIEGNIPGGPKRGVPQDDLRLHGGAVVGRYGGG
jgi:hypothetical protein